MITSTIDFVTWKYMDILMLGEQANTGSWTHVPGRYEGSYIPKTCIIAEQTTVNTQYTESCEHLICVSRTFLWQIKRVHHASRPRFFQGNRTTQKMGAYSHEFHGQHPVSPGIGYAPKRIAVILL